MVVQEESASTVTATHSPLHHFSLMPISPSTLTSPYPSLLSELSSADRGLLLIHLLVNYANHVTSRNFEAANSLLEHNSVLATPEGDTMQCMASYFTDTLARRLLCSLPGIYRALHSTHPASPSETHLARRHFFELCPFIKLELILSNKAIVEAMQGKKMVHIIDLHAWVEVRAELCSEMVPLRL